MKPYILFSCLIAILIAAFVAPKASWHKNGRLSSVKTSIAEAISDDPMNVIEEAEARAKRIYPEMVREKNGDYSYPVYAFVGHRSCLSACVGWIKPVDVNTRVSVASVGSLNHEKGSITPLGPISVPNLDQDGNIKGYRTRENDARWEFIKQNYAQRERGEPAVEPNSLDR